MPELRSYRVNECTHRRLKILAKKMGLPIGSTLTWILDQIIPIDASEAIEILQSPDEA